MRRLGLVAIAWVGVWGAVSSGAGEVVLVPEGKWGGRGARLELTAKGGTVEFDCAHGTLDEPLVLDAEGAFDAKGTYVAEGPGPVREDAGAKGRPVRYRGRLDGETLSLTVVRDEPAAAELGRFKAVRGRAGRLTKCL